MNIIDRFEVPYYQYLNEEGQLADEIPPLAEDTQALLHIYRLMVLVRMMDTKAIALQRTGKLGTYPSTRGQEAVFVGMGHAMAKTDIFVPYYRDMGTLVQRGVKLSQILLYWGGDERGNVFADSEDFPFSVPVGSQPLHAAGAAYAVKYHKEKRAVLATCGEGATSQGDFYEAMNVAGVWKLPVVFAVCNNQWAISVPRQAQTAAHTIAQKAIAAGFVGEQVDGNDVIAVSHRIAEALKNAREKHEPRLIELVCYRQHDHTTADDASRYESKDIRPKEWKKEPVARLRHYLEKKGEWNEQQEEALQTECAAEVDKAVEEYLSISPQPLESMFDYLYAELPETYRQQRDSLKEVEKAVHG
ncbi:pyruvate dehydrogenase (acetyl-transferring) E1 component subunit alpha [Aquicella lusitana]|uniref:Pyruvate dehydrogenase E1 component subunit alpha n=1 Tax=Aquicella lusitana TaxID=254246 RepID=A0A370G545_9COXI|nr:pyruvate dehydrogenase (acetyl-transferring) E1 component subunit alpha [Aquicella lusitana]RDI38961.1 pyruvate dehydrogenase E1 component alpha subunit [Aquicella lusitana]VVC74290.1 Pyruvate dehydrogenase E1 component subunit alpha [Aquicella lusitana]